MCRAHRYSLQDRYAADTRARDVLARGACLCRAHLSSFLCLVRSTVPPYDAINTDTELCLCCWSLVLMNPETGGFQCSF